MTKLCITQRHCYSNFKGEEMEVQRGDGPCPRSVSGSAWILPKDRLVPKPVPFLHLSGHGQMGTRNSCLQLEFSILFCSLFHLSTVCGTVSKHCLPKQRLLPFSSLLCSCLLESGFQCGFQCQMDLVCII